MNRCDPVTMHFTCFFRTQLHSFSLYFCRLSRSLAALCFAFYPCAIFAHYKYDPKGAVIGDFTSLSTSQPKVVFNYIAKCADVSFDNLNPCLVSGFLDILLKSPAYFNVTSCHAPQTSFADIDAIFSLVAYDCLGQGHAVGGDFLVGAQQFHNLVSESACWESLCDKDIVQYLESTWIKTCANVQLPFPLPADEDLVFISDSNVNRDTILTCMLDYVMDTPASAFGLTDPAAGSPLTCYPPGVDTLADDCHVIGEISFDECAVEFNGEDMDMLLTDMVIMSYNYRIEDHRDEIVFNFCGILQDLSTESARQCLLDLCELPVLPTSAPSGRPTTAPPATPSSEPVDPSTGTPVALLSPTQAPVFPSAPAQISVTTQAPVVQFTLPPAGLPTLSPQVQSPQGPVDSNNSASPGPIAAPTTQITFVPTPSPTKLPTLAPTPSPTKLPNLAPTSAPTIAPTKYPSLSPTLAPTKQPTLAPSNQPTPNPTKNPTYTSIPTHEPTKRPTSNPSPSPTPVPTKIPTFLPSDAPTTTSLSQVKNTTSIPTLAPSSAIGLNSILPSHIQSDYDIAASSAPVVFHAVLISTLVSLSCLL